MEIIFKYRFLVTLVIWSCTFVAVLCCDGAYPKHGTMTKDYDLEVGGTLSVKCTLFSHNLQENFTEYYVTSENLLLKFNSTYIENVEIVDPLSVQYTVENASVNDTGIYTCYLAIPQISYNPFVCTTYVAVGYKPLPVKNFSCISLNYRNLTCSWKNPFNPVKTKYELSDYLYIPSFKRRCPIITENSCQWRVDTQPPYRKSSSDLNFILTGSNSLGNYSAVIKVDNFKIVKPAEPGKIRFTNITKHSMRVLWDPPKGMEFNDFPPGLDYWLYYCPLFAPEYFCKVVNTKNETSTFIQELIPFTEYEFKLRCRSSVTERDDLWSPFSKSSMKTHPDVPYLAPEVTPSLFQVQNIQNNRSITLHWKPVPYFQENGDNFQYVIDYHLHYVSRRNKREYNHPVEIGNYTNFTFSNMDLNSAYLFRMYAKNSIGISNNYTITIVDKAANLLSGPYDIAVLLHGKGRYSISWSSHEKISNKDDSLNYTLFWCQSVLPRPFKCKGSLNWIYTNETKYELQLLDQNTNYQFAVAVNKNGLTSGMKWASCVVPYSGVLSKIKDVTLQPKNSTSLLVKWSLDCDAQKKVVTEYAVYYCKAASDTACSGPFSRVRLEKPVKTEYLLRSLQPYTKYRVLLRARTADGWSEDSDIKSESTLSAAPYDSPRNIKVLRVKDKVIHVSFQPPTKPNGKVTLYSVFYNQISYANPHKIDVHAESGTDTYEVEIEKGIVFYTNYSIQVEACVGLACSPRSKPVYVFTGIGVPGPMESPHIEIFNGSLVNITWKPPEVPNGPIDRYIVTYNQQIKDEYSNVEFNVSGHEQYLTVEFTCLPDVVDVSYSFKLQAVNVKNGIPLYGNHSEPARTKLCLSAEGTDVKLIVGLCVGISFGFVVLVLIIYVFVKWFKKEYDAAHIKIQLPSGLDSPIENPLNSYDKFKNGLQKKPGYGIPSDLAYERLPPFASSKIIKAFENSCSLNDAPKKNREKNGRNHSGESIASGKAHDSICSSNTNKTHISIDSGAEVDLPPSPDGIFSDTSSTNTTPRSYKPELDIVEENNSGSKDSGLEKEGLKAVSPYISKRSEIGNLSKFAWYVKKTPYTNMLLQKHQRQVSGYSKFAVVPSAAPSYVPVGIQNYNLIDQQSLSNSEPSVADFEDNSDSDPLMFDEAPPYCKFGLARSASNGLNLVRPSIATNQNIGYSKFGVIYKAFRRQDSDIQRNSALMSRPLNKTILCPQINQNPFVMPCQVIVPIDVENIGNFHVNNIKKGNEINAVGNITQNPVKRGYVSFRDALSNAVDSKHEDFPSKNTTELPNSAYSKFSLNSDINNENSCDDFGTRNTYKPSENKNDTPQLNFSSSEPPSHSSSYVSFQDAKVMVANDAPPTCSGVCVNNCSPNLVHEEQLPTYIAPENEKTTAEECCVNGDNDSDDTLKAENIENSKLVMCDDNKDVFDLNQIELANGDLHDKSININEHQSEYSEPVHNIDSGISVLHAEITDLPDDCLNESSDCDILPNANVSIKNIETSTSSNGKKKSNGYVAWTELTGDKNTNNVDVVISPKTAPLVKPEIV